MRDRSGKSDVPSDMVCWYAMSATYRSELSIKTALDEKGIESYIAMVAKVVMRRGRRVVARVPAVSNLIFVHASRETIQAVKPTLPHLQYKMRIEDGGSMPIVVKDSDMEAFIKVTTSVEEVQYIDPMSGELAAGTRVRVVSGPFAGLEGTCLRSSSRARNAMVFVSIDNLAAAGISISRKDLILA